LLPLLLTLIVPLDQLGVDQNASPTAKPKPKDIIPQAGLYAGYGG
jgi:hypothetical protein